MSGTYGLWYGLNVSPFKSTIGNRYYNSIQRLGLLFSRLMVDNPMMKQLALLQLFCLVMDDAAKALTIVWWCDTGLANV